MKHDTAPSPFNWNDGTPSIFAGNQTEAKLKAISSARGAKRRAAGDAYVSTVSVQVKTENILAMRGSAPIEGSSAGQASTDKRRSAAKARI